MPHTDYHVEMIPFPVIMCYAYFRIWLILKGTMKGAVIHEIWGKVFYVYPVSWNNLNKVNKNIKKNDVSMALIKLLHIFWYL
jgi:hypothetical protein